MNCARCEHSLEKHCKSGVKHVNHKQEMWPVPKDWHVCKVRHCLLPLCSCVDFVEPNLAEILARKTAEIEAIMPPTAYRTVEEIAEMAAAEGLEVIAPELPAMFTQPNSPAEIDAYQTALARDDR